MVDPERQPELLEAPRRTPSTRSSGDVGDDEVLLARDAHVAAGTLGQVGDGDHLIAGDQAEMDGHADVAQGPGCFCACTPRWSRGASDGRGQREVGERAPEALLDPLAHALGPDVVDHELEPRLDAADAVVQVGRPGSGDRREHLDGLVLGHEHAELPGDL